MSGAPRPEVRTLATTTHGRFLLSVPEAPGPHPLLVGFHGYGENAERNLEALRAIPGSAAWLLCAVQALHRFYDRKTETVVGCWMTKQDRALAIADNVAYVRGVLEALRAEGWDGTTLVYAGFSQGVAMAYRAAAFAGITARGLIALAGDLPEDVRATGMAGFPPLLIGTGRLDPWYTPLQLAEDAAALGGLGIQPETTVFEGGHGWMAAFQERAGAFLAARRRG